MATDKGSWSRRQFLKTGTLAGLGAMTRPVVAAADTGPAKVPTRLFGRSGMAVSVLSLGGMFDVPNNQLLLKQAVRWGATYWDTADCYGGGDSEKGIGKYFKRNPADRERIFLVTKSDARDPRGMTRLLNRSLERMNTGVIDLYLLHGIRSTRALDDDVRRWVEQAKADGKIRLFGFSTHSNMERCMMGAAELGWIDGIMMTYNYRLMHEPEMKAAVAACKAAGIGLTAMKTQGGGQVRTHTETEVALAGRFVRKGFTAEQAKLKAVWENRDVASICSQMPNMAILSANVAAAVDRTRLSGTDMRLFRQVAEETRSDYCGGCSRICEGCLDAPVPVADVLRYLMYSRSYGDRDRARELFGGLAPDTRSAIAGTDFRAAEAACPRRIRIGRLLTEALVELA